MALTPGARRLAREAPRRRRPRRPHRAQPRCQPPLRHARRDRTMSTAHNEGDDRRRGGRTRAIESCFTPSPSVVSSSSTSSSPSGDFAAARPRGSAIRRSTPSPSSAPPSPRVPRRWARSRPAPDRYRPPSSSRPRRTSSAVTSSFPPDRAASPPRSPGPSAGNSPGTATTPPTVACARAPTTIATGTPDDAIVLVIGCSSSVTAAVAGTPGYTCKTEGRRRPIRAASPPRLRGMTPRHE